jgi:DNA mismatch repair ATPase MutL
MQSAQQHTLATEAETPTPNEMVAMKNPVWTNPVYTSNEPPINCLAAGSLPSIVSLQASDFSKATVINQIDRKFILITIPLDNGLMVALVDQHAADERHRLESILTGLPSSTRSLQQAIEFPCPEQHLSTLGRRKDQLLRWGVGIDILDETVRITEVPTILKDVDAARWKSILVGYALEDEREYPTGLMEIFCSKACRSVLAPLDIRNNRQSCLTISSARKNVKTS